MKDDDYRLRLICEYGSQLLDALDDLDITREKVLSSREVQWLVSTPLANIGEQAYRLSDEVTQRYDDIPWKQIKGLRHRIVHDYAGTSWEAICQVLFEDLPPFVKQVGEIVAARDGANTVREELIELSEHETKRDRPSNQFRGLKR